MRLPLTLFVLLLLPSTGRAEAGVALEICRTGSCACYGVTCGCGQVCTGNGCQASNAAFCNGDVQCAASCGDFVCELSHCVSGTRVDGGLVPGDGGQSGPMIDGGSSVMTPVPMGGCGCSSGAGWGLLALVLLAIRQRTGALTGTANVSTLLSMKRGTSTRCSRVS